MKAFPELPFQGKHQIQLLCTWASFTGRDNQGKGYGAVTKKKRQLRRELKILHCGKPGTEKR